LAAREVRARRKRRKKKEEKTRKEEKMKTQTERHLKYRPTTLFESSVLAGNLRPDLSTKHTFPNRASMSKRFCKNPRKLGNLGLPGIEI